MRGALPLSLVAARSRHGSECPPLADAFIHYRVDPSLPPLKSLLQLQKTNQSFPLTLVTLKTQKKDNERLGLNYV